ncbi:unnamed protein product [Euphydryas editha]|uniref:FP protein C-terminal domain-containing protein n=1 Tax=Euphydryas editha TaxID=104508 RepID=A0AAU9U378_EUPED|nr:unnamed protein product [Euphydryas editha]
MDRTPPNYVAQRNKRGRENEYVHDFNTFREEIKSMISNLMAAQQEEIKKNHPTLMEIKATNSDIQNSVEFLASQNEELKKKIEQLETQTKKDKDYITLLEDKVEELQRENRKANLTAKGARLYFLARDLAKSQNYKFCWTSYGRIYVRKNENSPVIVIKNENHVNSLMQKE